MLLGNATQVPARHDCRELWLFVQFLGEVCVLLGTGIAVLFVGRTFGLDHVYHYHLRGCLQYLRFVSLPQIPTDPRKDRGGGGQANRS